MPTHWYIEVGNLQPKSFIWKSEKSTHVDVISVYLYIGGNNSPWWYITTTVDSLMLVNLLC